MKELIELFKNKKEGAEKEAKRLAANSCYELAGFYSAQAKAFDFCLQELLSKSNEMESLLKEYEEWEAMLIADNAMWWPYADKDAMSGKTYDMMLELQAKRNELLGR